MSELSSSSTLAGPDLKQNSASFQATWTLSAVFVLACTLCLFLYVQVRYAKRDLISTQQLAVPMIQNFQQEKPKLDAFLLRLVDYGRTHPDFAPILTKYKAFMPAGNAAAPSKPAKK